MNVSLSTEFESLINEKVKSGMYHSASEVVREGLRLLQERDRLRDEKLAQLRAGLQLGIHAIEAGDVYDGPETMAAFRKKLLKEKKRRNG